MTDAVCYYSVGQSCGVVVTDVWMRGRRGPKQRTVCKTCLFWLESGHLADRVWATSAVASPWPVAVAEQLVHLVDAVGANLPPLQLAGLVPSDSPHDACYGKRKLR